MLMSNYYKVLYCDLRGQIKENAEELHHVLHSSSREQSNIARACIMSLIMHAPAFYIINYTAINSLTSKETWISQYNS